MNILQLIKTRKSIRTFDERKITDDDKKKLYQYIKTIENPLNIPVDFVFLDSDDFDLSSPVIHGEDFYIAAKVPRTHFCEVAYGYSFEKMVLYAWSLGIGTTWIGGTFERDLFEKAAGTCQDEFMMIATPVGYPSDTPTIVDRNLREKIRGDERLSCKELFFEDDFSTPLESNEDCIEAVRWSPSAANMQPWRIIKENNYYHFYLAHTQGYSSNVEWDIQKIDMGIAICHFMSSCGGNFEINNPNIKTNNHTEYIATVRL